MAFLLEHLPPRIHLVIATRADPSLPVARLRGRGELVEVRVADLRFTADEAAVYLEQVMGLALTPADVAALEGRTEGWIAALQLAALSLQGRDDVAGFVAGFAGDDRYIVDYLVEEVLARQPEPVRDFLLQTSVLSRLNGILCDAVTGQVGGKAMLEALEPANLFLVPLDDRRQWYRYHHLFADVLRARLLDEQAGQLRELHLRASTWYAANARCRQARIRELMDAPTDSRDVPRSGKGVTVVVRSRGLRRELRQEAVEPPVRPLGQRATVLPDAVLRPPLAGRRVALVLVDVVHPEPRAERLTEDQHAAPGDEDRLQRLGGLDVRTGGPGQWGSDPAEPRPHPAWPRHSERVAAPRSQSRMTLMVQGAGAGRTREVPDAGTEAVHRRQLRRGEGQHLPLHSHRGELAVDVDGASVAPSRGVDLEVDVEPPALVVGTVADVAVEDTDEHPVTIQRHLPDPRPGRFRR
jgi:hypothetical protein